LIEVEDTKEFINSKVSSSSLEPKGRKNEFINSVTCHSDVTSILHGDKALLHSIPFEKSQKEEDEIEEYVKEITLHMVEVVCKLVTDESSSSQGFSCTQDPWGRKPASKDCSRLAVDTSASSKLDSLLTEGSQADECPGGNGGRKKKTNRERKQSFGGKKKFREESEGAAQKQLGKD